MKSDCGSSAGGFRSGPESMVGRPAGLLQTADEIERVRARQETQDDDQEQPAAAELDPRAAHRHASTVLDVLAAAHVSPAHLGTSWVRRTGRGRRSSSMRQGIATPQREVGHRSGGHRGPRPSLQPAGWSSKIAAGPNALMETRPARLRGGARADHRSSPTWVAWIAPGWPASSRRCTSRPGQVDRAPGRPPRRLLRDQARAGGGAGRRRPTVGRRRRRRRGPSPSRRSGRARSSGRWRSSPTRRARRRSSPRRTSPSGGCPGPDSRRSSTTSAASPGASSGP